MSRSLAGPVAGLGTPASAANLGPGYDTLGLALAMHDRLEAEVLDDGLEVVVSGEGADDLPRDRSHLVVRAMDAAFDVLGEQPAGLRLTCDNTIPHARGLGSSSAAIVGGIVLARALVDGGEERLDDAAALPARVRPRGPPRQRGGGDVRRLHHRLARRSGRLGAAARRHREGDRAGAARAGLDRSRTRPPARPRPASGRGRQRGACRPARRGTHRRSRLTCSPPPRTSCTSRTGPRRCRVVRAGAGSALGGRPGGHLRRRSLGARVRPRTRRRRAARLGRRTSSTSSRAVPTSP